MAELSKMTPGQILNETSVAEMVAALSLSIAEAQKSLDDNSIQQLPNFTRRVPALGDKSLIELGFSPAFYHFQSAEISTSMNLRMQVAESTGFGLALNANYNSNSSNSDQSNNSSNSAENSSSQRSSTTQRNVTIKSTSSATFSINGQNVSLDANLDYRNRMTTVAAAIRSNTNNGVDRVALNRNCTVVALAHGSATPTANIILKSSPAPSSVAFIASGVDWGIIRIAQAAATSYTISAALSVTQNNADTVNVAADNVATSIDTNNADAFLAFSIKDNVSLTAVMPHFGFDEDDIRTQDKPALQRLARFLKATGYSAKLIGHTDRSGSAEYNVGLSERRVMEVKRHLIALDVAPNTLSTEHKGETEPAAGGNTADGSRDERNRRVEIQVNVPDATAYIYLEGENANAEITIPPNPDETANGSIGNGFIHVEDADIAVNFQGDVNVAGRSYTLNGASTDLLAKNLADAINADSNSSVLASATGNIVFLCNKQDTTTLSFFSTSARTLDISSQSSEIVVEQQTSSRSNEENAVRRNEGNTTVAIGGSVDFRMSRQFNLDITGNSSVSAKLVSIPAPPEFLETIKEFLADS